MAVAIVDKQDNAMLFKLPSNSIGPPKIAFSNGVEFKDQARWKSLEALHWLSNMQSSARMSTHTDSLLISAPDTMTFANRKSLGPKHYSIPKT